MHPAILVPHPTTSPSSAAAAAAADVRRSLEHVRLRHAAARVTDQLPRWTPTPRDGTIGRLRPRTTMAALKESTMAQSTTVPASSSLRDPDRAHMLTSP